MPCEPGEVLLVSCYELGHVPMGLAMPAAFLERAGIEPALADVAVEPLDEEAVRRARFVGISVPMHTALRLGREVGRRVRALNPGAHVCFFGLYASLNANLLRRSGADSVLGGELEEALVRRVREVLAGLGASERVETPLEKVDFCVPSRRRLQPLDSYAKILRGDVPGRAGYVEASRGCLHRCRHCPIPPVYGGRFFVVPVDVVLADVRQLVEAGASHVTFGDPDFLNGPRHAMEIARALHEEFPALSFDVTTKVEHILRSEALLGEMGSLGCLFVVSAVESLSDEVLRRLDKGHTRADAIRAARIVRDAGIAFRPALLPFTPWSTLRDFLDLIAWIEEDDLVDAVDPVQLAIRLLVPPGSLMLADRTFAGVPFDEERLTFVWRHPDPRMDRLQAALAALVEEAARDEEDPFVTFSRIRDRAFLEAAQSAPPALPIPKRRRAPRLSEPWFC